VELGWWAANENGGKLEAQNWGFQYFDRTVSSFARQGYSYISPIKKMKESPKEAPSAFAKKILTKRSDGNKAITDFRPKSFVINNLDYYL